jgi:hypothetical protein
VDTVLAWNRSIVLFSRKTVKGRETKASCVGRTPPTFLNKKTFTKNYNARYDFSSTHRMPSSTPSPVFAQHAPTCHARWVGDASSSTKFIAVAISAADRARGKSLLLAKIINGTFFKLSCFNTSFSAFFADSIPDSSPALSTTNTTAFASW